MKNSVGAACVLAMLTGCGGGVDVPLLAGGLPLLLSQIVECRAAAIDDSRFNAAARVLAASDELSICAAWPISSRMNCGQAFSLYSKPYSGICI